MKTLKTLFITSKVDELSIRGESARFPDIKSCFIAIVVSEPLMRGSQGERYHARPNGTELNWRDLAAVHHWHAAEA